MFRDTGDGSTNFYCGCNRPSYTHSICDTCGGVDPPPADLVAEMRGFEDDHEPDGWPAVRMRQISALCDEIARLRHRLTELGKAADAAAMVIATIEAEDTTEEEKLQSVMDAIQTWAPDAMLAQTERFFPFEFEVWQGDEMVSSASGPRETALREAMHYAAQYGQDGPVRVFEVTRTVVTPNERGQGPAACGRSAAPTGCASKCSE